IGRWDRGRGRDGGRVCLVPSISFHPSLHLLVLSRLVESFDYRIPQTAGSFSLLWPVSIGSCRGRWGQFEAGK
ncbi:hypothetical protein PENTCL1PPCAC_26433, partial [Pristionchus entomophagus]